MEIDQVMKQAEVQIEIKEQKISIKHYRVKDEVKMFIQIINVENEELKEIIRRRKEI